MSTEQEVKEKVTTTKTKKVQIEVVQSFYDLLLKEDKNIGDKYTVKDERAKHLAKLGLVKIV